MGDACGGLVGALSAGWWALARLLLRQGRPHLARVAEEIAQALAQAAEPERESAGEDPPDDPEPERLMQEPTAPPLRRTAAGRLVPRTVMKLG